MTEQVPSEQFSIGEVAIYCRPGSLYFGAEVTIMSALKEMRLHDARTVTTEQALAYEIDGPFGPFLDGRPWCSRPEWLKKKKPPRRDLEVVRWADCPWQPESINV